MFRFLLAALFFFAAFTANAQADFAERLAKSKAYLEQGQYRIALDEAQKARELAETDQEKTRSAGAAGNLFLILKQYGEAETALLSALEGSAETAEEKAGYANNLGILYSAQDTIPDPCSASCRDNDFGNLHSAQDKADKAESYFAQALQWVGDNPTLRLNIKLNRLHNKPSAAEPAMLDELLRDIAKLPAATEKIRNAIGFAAIAQAADNPASRELALKALEQARADSEGLKDARLKIELLASLADKYEKRGQEDKALKLSEEATEIQAEEDVRDLLIDPEWRKARLYRKQGRDDLSLLAFGKAVDHIQAVRMDIPVEYHDGHSSFRETLEPIYLGYADQLLKKAGRQDGDLKQKTLLQARQAVEQIKQTEMEDFLGGRCLIEGLHHSELDNIDAGAATVYPIILPDRLELLVGFGKTIRQYTTPVSEKQLRESATAFAEKLRGMAANYRQDSKNLYQWLIAPIEKDLDAANIKTLVIVPDGVLRLTPFSALNNGRHYLIEKFALSVSPGMSLMAGGGNAGNRGYQTLLAGLSRPGAVVEKLPTHIVNGILDAGQGQNRGQRSLPATRALGAANLRAADKADSAHAAKTAETDMLLRTPGTLQKLQDQLSLPGVEDEMKAVTQSVKNTTLLNETFTVDGFHQAASSRQYEIIHIASHGIFSSAAENSFIMAHDNVLKINELETLLKGEKTGQSIDLLTLSACETAEGDDRAPMGFTGAALKANARSAIGSLWPISDEAAAQLMGDFYRNLTRIHNKAEALRQSQLELMKIKNMAHPFFWSPFILVGNWI